MLRGAVDGNVYAAGHAEGGNDLPVLLSSTTAERVEGGYRFNGRKSFGTLTPVWIVKEGPAGLDAFILNIFARCLMGFGNVYYGLARQAFDVTLRPSRISVHFSCRGRFRITPRFSMLWRRWGYRSRDRAALDRVAEDWSALKDHGALWPMRRVGRSLMPRWMWLADLAFSEERARASVPNNCRMVVR